VPVAEWDERFSTRQAEAGAGRASKRRSGEVDSLAAALVLQGYLDAERTRGART
jgi:RNase H-fold protein (predicted Holliday junction resolvase)